MTAGRGVMHSEMPSQSSPRNVGLQLWVDLPQDLKACEPRYRDLKAAEIPLASVDDGRVAVKVISGQSHGVDSVRDLAYTPVWILDIEIKPGGKIEQPLPKGWNAFAYTLEGDVIVGKDDQRRVVAQYNNVVFEQEGDVVHFEVDAGAEKPARLGMSPPLLNLLSWTLTNKRNSSNRRNSPRPTRRPVRPLRPHLQGRGRQGPLRLPDSLERFRASKGLGE